METKGFFGRLFDMSFSSFITTSIIKVLYVLGLIVIGLTALGFVIAAFADSAGAGIFVLLIAAPLLSLLWVIYVRVILELIIVLFRIMETNKEQVELLRAQAPPTSPPPPAEPPPAPAAG